MIVVAVAVVAVAAIAAVAAAIAVVVVVGNYCFFVAAIVVSISISLSTFNYVVTCVGLREQRARGRNASHPNAASGSIGRLHLAFKTR